MKTPYAIICADCDEPIKENDEYVSVGGNDYHLYCLEIMTTRELIESLRHEIKTLEEEEYGKCD